MPNSDFIYSFVSTLNQALSKDRNAVKKVMLTNTKAQYDFINDPDIIVNSNNELSALALFNSMINVYCGKKIVSCTEDDGTLTKFKVIEESVKN